MNSILIGLGVFATIFVAAEFGIALRKRIPDAHLGSEAKDVIRLVTGITATTSALVLGMLVSSAKTYYDSWNTQIAETASEVVTIDRLFADYGPETAQIRVQFANLVEGGVERIWPKRDPLQVALKPQQVGDDLLHQVEALTPKDSLQTVAKSQIMPMITTLRQGQWRMYLRTQQTSMPVPLLVIVISWQALIFVSMGLFAPPNPTIHVTFVLGALIISAAVFIILEMYSPFRGILTISSAPITDALRQMQQ
jgi:hypothetical protein